ncbi:MAG TPA: ATP-binding protein [Oligoflexus sp.]|uniref:ATP-binding protein n=1 Tax=Oligoflexus sp. TaxID=1971216 RepID=UPI002D7E9252|nr:ATP-binding protein [Oligoflexus sp.]HET9238297.1 ATP-binding protein [Oligoflexus sp.]
MQILGRGLLILSALFQAPVVAASGLVLHRTVQVEQGELKLELPPDEVQVLQGAWRFTEQPVTSMDAARFRELPLRNPLTGDFFYTMFSDLPERGHFILALGAEQPMSFSVMLGGLVAQGELTLVTADGPRTVYRPPSELIPADGRGRLQIPHPTFVVLLPAGVSYLVYSYEQAPVRKGQEWVSNAGLVGPFQFGSAHKIRQRFQFHELFLKIPMGVFACLFVYSLLIYKSRHREDEESLILAFINGLTFFREVLTQTVVLNYIPSSASLQVVHAFGTALPLLVTALAIHYLHFKYPSRWLAFLRAVVTLNFCVIAVNNILMPFPNPWLDTSFLTMNCYVLNAILFFIFFIPYMVWISFRTRNKEITNFSIGVLFMAAGTLSDFINSLGNHGWPWLAMWGGMVLSVVLAKNNSRMFAKAFDTAKQLNAALTAKNHEIEALNQSLEQKVSQRTAEMRALLEYIPQGVLSIGAGGAVEANYSAHLPDVLEQKAIAGASFRTLFLDHLELGFDDKDQVWQAIIGSVGENSLTFELNSDKFPSEVGYCFQGQLKILKLTWNIECDAQQEVLRILVTMLDVTLEITTRRELEEKNTDLSIIRQLLEAGVRKCVQFFSSCDQLLRESELLIQADRVDGEALKIVFVNIHTIKGAARTLQFKALSAVLHAAESGYAQAIRIAQTPDSQALAADLRRVRAMFDRYLHVNREVLGRDSGLTKVPLDRDFLEEHHALLQNLAQRPGVPADLKPSLQRSRDTLAQAVFVSLRAALDDILGQVATIARDLQKEAPRLQLEVDDILINHRQENVLKNCFLHLLRNSLDHGIEEAPEREAQGKARQATLFVKAWRVEEQLVIEYWDDGRGLALPRLKERALTLGLLTPSAPALEIANTVFHEGVSTAQSLSQISGRGIGMSAVKRFLETEQGNIEIMLPDQIRGDQVFVRFRFRMSMTIHPSMASGMDEQVA